MTKIIFLIIGFGLGLLLVYSCDAPSTGPDVPADWKIYLTMSDSTYSVRSGELGPLLNAMYSPPHMDSLCRFDWVLIRLEKQHPKGAEREKE